MALRRLFSNLFWSWKLIRSGSWERKKTLTRNYRGKKLVEKWRFWSGFDAVLKLKTDEKWSLGANKILSRKNFGRKKDIFVGFWCCVEVENWWELVPGNDFFLSKNFTFRLVLTLFWSWKLMRSGPWGWEPKKYVSRKKCRSKNDTFHLVTMLFDDENWWEVVSGSEKISRKNLIEKRHSSFSFDAVSMLKSDEKWFLGAKIN